MRCLESRRERSANGSQGNLLSQVYHVYLLHLTCIFDTFVHGYIRAEAGDWPHNCCGLVCHPAGRLTHARCTEIVSWKEDVVQHDYTLIQL